MDAGSYRAACCSSCAGAVVCACLWPRAAGSTVQPGSHEERAVHSVTSCHSQVCGTHKYIESPSSINQPDQTSFTNQGQSTLLELMA